MNGLAGLPVGVEYGISRLFIGVHFPAKCTPPRPYQPFEPHKRFDINKWRKVLIPCAALIILISLLSQR